MPEVAVCVPYWKRQEALDKMFEQYARLYPDLSIEFSVCDDGSPEPARVPEEVTLTRLPAKTHDLNPCVPINRAVEASSAPIIALTNPEIEHRGPVLPELLSLLEGPDDYAMARCWCVDRRRWLAGPEVDYRKHGRLPVPPGAHFHFLTALRRELWEKAGGFDEDYRRGTGCDDNDWLWRLHSVGARFRLSEGVVYHYRGDSRWTMPHNRKLFRAKWPEAVR